MKWAPKGLKFSGLRQIRFQVHVNHVGHKRAKILDTNVSTVWTPTCQLSRHQRVNNELEDHCPNRGGGHQTKH